MNVNITLITTTIVVYLNYVARAKPGLSRLYIPIGIYIYIYIYIYISIYGNVYLVYTRVHKCAHGSTV